MCGTSAETVSVTSDPGVWEGGRLRVSPTRVVCGVWVRRVACGCGAWRVGAACGCPPGPAGRGRPAKLVRRNLLSVFYKLSLKEFKNI